MRYLMICTYNGRNYAGFQKQNLHPTIQGELENALKILFKQDVSTVGSGRTDAGVSAYRQPVHFEIDKEIDANKFVHSMNGILPSEIRVLSVEKSDIHARFSAKEKTYVYKMYISNIDLPLCSNALRISPILDFKSMRKFLKLLKGTHDFKGFRASGSPTDTTIRTIYSIKLKATKNSADLFITGNGFLYKMVRNIVGTMLKIGEGKTSLKDIKPTLFTSFKATNTAKPEFLYLFDVKYNEKQLTIPSLNSYNEQ